MSSTSDRISLLEGPKRALVTGAGARLGRAMAVALGAQGWGVGVHYRTSKQGAEETAHMIEQAGGKAAIVKADLADEAETSALIGNAQAETGGPLTLLINSASTFEDDRADTHTRESWNFHMEPNLRAPVKLSQGFAAALPENHEGLVVNMIDMRIRKLNPQFFTYMLSKSALWTATQTMAQAFAPRIRVNAIGPGPTLQNVHQSKEQFEAECEATLTQQGSNPDEIVRALEYLIDAQSVTGQMICSDGGQHLMWQTPDVLI